MGLPCWKVEVEYLPVTAGRVKIEKSCHGHLVTALGILPQAAFKHVDTSVVLYDPLEVIFKGLRAPLPSVLKELDASWKAFFSRLWPNGYQSLFQVSCASAKYYHICAVEGEISGDSASKAHLCLPAITGRGIFCQTDL